MSHTGPRLMGPLACRNGRGATQHPEQATDATAEKMNIYVYSAMKNIGKKKPLYSVWKLATCSLSASGMSNGVRLHSASPAATNMTKAMGISGKYLNISQCPSPPACASTMSCSERL